MSEKTKKELEPTAVQETAVDNDSSEKVQDTTVWPKAESSETVEPEIVKSGQKTVLVICSYPGKEGLVQKIWDMMLPKVDKKVITVTDDLPIQEVLADLIIDETVAEKFVFVPAVALPCAPVSFEELQMPVVFKDAKGGLHYNNRLPVLIDKEVMAIQLGEAKTEDPEAIMKKYVTSRGRAVEVAFKEGNFVTPVLRGNPCEHVVMEALIRKKYIVANAAGLEAITPLLLQTLLDE
jgi:hypothetical protein